MKVEKDWQNIEQKWTNETHHCRVVTLEFGAETRTLPPWLRVKREYRNDTYLFSTNPSQSFSVAIHKAEKIERSWGLNIKTTAQNSSQNPSRCFAARRWTCKLIGPEVFEMYKPRFRYSYLQWKGRVSKIFVLCTFDHFYFTKEHTF